MGLAEIENKILEEAETEAKKIREQAAEESAQIGNEAKSKAESLRRQIITEAKKKAEEETKAILVPARLAAKKNILQEKHKILGEVFSGLPQNIREEKEIEVANYIYG